MRQKSFSQKSMEIIDMARQGYLSLRLTTQERELYQELADRKGVTLADWIRSGLAIIAYMEGKNREDKDNGL